MKFARYEAHGEVAYGVVENDAVFQLTTTPFEDYEITDHGHGLDDVHLLAPHIPGKLMAIGLNYASHLGDKTPPAVPEPFFKPTSAIINPGDSIVIPEGATKVQEEGELVVVIGKRCKGVSRANALDYVLGYTCGNDVSERVWQSGDLQWWRGKGSDTFAPLGPYIVTDVEPGDLQLTACVNGEVAQESSTANLIHDVPAIIEWVSRAMTLEAGDMIMTGTPGQPWDINPGDTVDVEIEGVGVLTNPVR